MSTGEPDITRCAERAFALDGKAIYYVVGVVPAVPPKCCQPESADILATVNAAAPSLQLLYDNLVQIRLLLLRMPDDLVAPRLGV